MLDEILDMFGRKKKSPGAPGTAERGGIGGLFDRVQGAMEGDGDHDDRRRGSDRDDDRRGYRDDDPYDRDDDGYGGRGRRREREGFDFGDD